MKRKLLKVLANLNTEFALKILSVLIALLLWSYVKSEQKQQRSLDVELELVNLPNHLMLEREVDAQIKVKVIGPKSRVESMNQEYLGTLSLDLSKSHIGLNTFWIQEDDFKLPYGIKIDRIVPQIIRVDLDKAITNTLPVLPKFIGKLPEGFEMTSYDLDPEVMTVKGTQRSMEALKKLYTTDIDLKSMRSYYEQEVPIDTSSLNVKLQHNTVLLRVTIKENTVSKTLKKVAIQYDSELYRVNPKTVTINVEGMAGDMLSLDQKNINVEIEELPNLFQPAIKINPIVSGLPKNVRYTVFPESVSVQRIKK
ncbi:MAG TPA: CdaR family protein [Oligoflexia bacterium]|nr:CdaR family protein [Oligoflexia bacterium]HMR24170.1 CdaR family protein [Oligoflexia bacterium]